MPTISVPEAIVVSGDLIRGVPLKAANYADELSKQYAVAEEFLDNLVKRFLSGDRSRVVIIPGNHDVDWNTAFNSMQPIEAKDFPPNLSSVLYHENSNYRWDWETLTLYRIADPAMYALRLESFWKFFERFYAGVGGLYKVKARTDANLFLLCDNRIGVAAFNSCHGNDCFAFHGMIRKEVIAKSHLELNDSGKVFDLLMAVWHHNIEGPPYRSDYMDADIVRGMIGRGFRLGLYGHQHKAQVTPHQIWLPDRERMAVVSAGSLCAGHRELPTGVFRQYNILEINDTFTSVRVHVRTMAVSNLFSRGRLVDLGDKSFADLDWVLPRNAVGGSVDTKAARLSIIVGEAELAAKTGNPARAVELLRPLELPAASYERQLFVTAAHSCDNWAAIIEKTDPPATIEELVYRVESLNRLGDASGAMAALDEFADKVNLPESEATNLRFRIKTKERISQ
jgi:hypothetical protein